MYNLVRLHGGYLVAVLKGYLHWHALWLVETLWSKSMLTKEVPIFVGVQLLEEEYLSWALTV